MRNRFYLDELYQATLIRLHDNSGSIAAWIDRWIIAGLAVRGTHGTTELVGRALRLFQTGNLQTYAFLFALGVALLCCSYSGTQMTTDPDADHIILGWPLMAARCSHWSRAIIGW